MFVRGLLIRARNKNKDCGWSIIEDYNKGGSLNSKKGYGEV